MSTEPLPDQRAAGLRLGRIHITADVSPAATVHPSARIWRWSCVRAGAQIDADVQIGQGVYIDEHVVVGPGCRIHNGAQLYWGTRLGPRVFVGAHVVTTNVQRPRAFFEQKDARQGPTIGEGATIGAGAVLVGNVRIGAFALVGAGAVVTRDVPAYTEVMGVPARVVGLVDVDGQPVDRAWVNAEGIDGV